MLYIRYSLDTNHTAYASADLLFSIKQIIAYDFYYQVSISTLSVICLENNEILVAFLTLGLVHHIFSFQRIRSFSIL